MRGPGPLGMSHCWNISSFIFASLSNPFILHEPAGYPSVSGVETYEHMAYVTHQQGSAMLLASNLLIVIFRDVKVLSSVTLLISQSSLWQWRYNCFSCVLEFETDVCFLKRRKNIAQGLYTNKTPQSPPICCHPALFSVFDAKEA